MRAIGTMIACLMLAFGGEPAADRRGPHEATHNWTQISYPQLPALPNGAPTPSIFVSNNDDRGLQLNLLFHVPARDGNVIGNRPDTAGMLVRMHTASGKIVDPLPDDGRGSFGIGGPRGIQVNCAYTFEWQRNALDEAWIEIQLQQQTYWVEIPYGYIRNPNDTLTVDVPRHGTPEFPPTMKLGETDLLVPWRNVHYDLGRIQNGWVFSVLLSNPFDAAVELRLYRESGNAKGAWNLYEPRTSVAIQQPGDEVIDGIGSSIHLSRDRLWRTAGFEFNRNPGGEERSWGTVKATVGEASYRIVAPSSMFKYTHGTTDPYHDALIER